MSIGERRFESRFLCADLVRVTWLETACPETAWLESALQAPASQESIEQSAGAVLEDISALGACVQVEQSIPLDVLITLSVGGTNFRGRVCYSVFRDYGHFVGIRFAEDTVWSSDLVLPQHLTSYESLTQ